MGYFSDANLTGGSDIKAQRKHNYLVELLDRGYITNGVIDGVNIQVRVDPKNGLAFYQDGIKTGGLAIVNGKIVLTTDIISSSGFPDQWIQFVPDTTDGIATIWYGPNKDLLDPKNVQFLSIYGDVDSSGPHAKVYVNAAPIADTGLLTYPSDLLLGVNNYAVAHEQRAHIWLHGNEDASYVELTAVGATAFDFKTLKITPTAATIDGSTIWHGGNDGTGSGLDADKLDTYEASDFLRLAGGGTITSRITLDGGATLFVLKAGPTADHVYMQFFADSDNQATRSAYFGFSTAGTATITLANEVLGGNIDLRTVGSGLLRINANVVWHEGNDGTGSGLDADKLDGSEASEFLKLIGGTMSGNLTFADGVNIVVNTTTGTKIGTGTTQKLGFFNATPVVQRTTYTQTYSTASKTVPAPTAATLTDSTGGTANTTLEAVGTTYSQTVVRNNFADLAAMVNKNTADTLAIFKVVTALIDDLQALGFVA